MGPDALAKAEWQFPVLRLGRGCGIQENPEAAKNLLEYLERIPPKRNLQTRGSSPKGLASQGNYGRIPWGESAEANTLQGWQL